MGQSRRGVAEDRATATATAVTAKYVITPERKNFWSFLPLKNPRRRR